MNTKTVSQLDAEGYFSCQTIADESPLEPGIWLIPGGAIDQPPPANITAGKRYRPLNGAWIEEDAPDSAGAQPFPTTETADEVAGNKRAGINHAAEVELSALIASYPAGEVASWPQQTSEATALQQALAAKGALLDSEIQAIAPLLHAIATARGIPVTELANRVLAKVQQFSIVSGQIIGKRQALEDAIAAVDLQADDAIAQLEAIAW